jgi:site-specific recombinase XerD
VNQEIIASFVADLLRKNRSERTQEAYRRDMQQFAAWLGREIKDATRKDVEQYALYLRVDKKYRVVTQRRSLTTIRVFFKFPEVSYGW